VIKATSEAKAATAKATTAAGNADESRLLVEQVKKETIAAKDATIKATSEAKDATAKATTAAGNVNTAITDLKALITRMKPKSMSLQYPQELTEGNVRLQKIEVELNPAGVDKNILYIAHNEEVMHVMPDGTIVPKGKGKCTIYVIPTANTSIYQAINIEIKTRGIRMHTLNQIRFLGKNSKNMRFN